MGCLVATDPEDPDPHLTATGSTGVSRPPPPQVRRARKRRTPTRDRSPCSSCHDRSGRSARGPGRRLPDRQARARHSRGGTYVRTSRRLWFVSTSTRPPTAIPSSPSRSDHHVSASMSSCSSQARPTPRSTPWCWLKPSALAPPSNRAEGVDQLRSYMAACLNAQYGIWTNGDEKFCLAKRSVLPPSCGANPEKVGRPSAPAPEC